MQFLLWKSRDINLFARMDKLTMALCCKNKDEFASFFMVDMEITEVCAHNLCFSY